MTLYICTKFQIHISQGFRVTKQSHSIIIYKGYNSIKMKVELRYLFCAYQSSRKSAEPPDMSGKIVSGPVTIPRNPNRMSGVIFAPKI